MHTQHVSRAYKSQTSASSAASQWRLYRHDSRNEGRYSLFGRRGISIYVIQSLLSHGTVCINSVLGSTHNVLKKAVSSLGKKSRKLSFRFTVCLKQWGLDHQGRPWSLVLPIEATLPSVEKKKKKPEQLNQTKPNQEKLPQEQWWLSKTSNLFIHNKAFFINSSRKDSKKRRILCTET